MTKKHGKESDKYRADEKVVKSRTKRINMLNEELKLVRSMCMTGAAGSFFE